ncbi:MAG: hypothetical protein ACHQFW_02440 [Chitinophagales bacterium]
MKNSIKHKLLIFISMLSVSAVMYAQDSKINYDRPYNKNGMNVFETSKLDLVPYEGFKLKISGGFTQQFQALSHSNTADAVLKDNTLTSTVGDSVNINALYPITNGFNLATANLILVAQLDDGISIKLENYMSSRHHNEFWVKGGYIQVDKLPMFGNPEWFTKNFTVKIGQMEVNYGDAHFFRTDNANGIYNAFVGENILDAFATEIAGEVYFKPENGAIAMLGMSSGLLNADLSIFKNPVTFDTISRKPSIYAKLGYDKQLSDDLRVRLTASVYNNSGSSRNTLYAGDRAGSRYYFAGEQQYYMSGATLTAATTSNKAFSGRVDPGFASEVMSIMINPFVKFHGLEIFGTYEISKGDSKLSSLTAGDSVKRDFNQIAAQFVYRFLENEQCYVGFRYNTVTGNLFGYTAEDGDINVNRMQVSAGWFPTDNLLLKLEYVDQKYENFKTTDYRNGLEFKGLMVEASVGF